MKQMINVFGKMYSLSTLKAHGNVCNDIIDDATKEELKQYKIKFRGTIKRGFFKDEINIEIVKKMGGYSEEWWYDINFQEFVLRLRQMMKIYDRKDELYKRLK